MRYLLDVNALLAWHHSGSAHHAAFHRWKKKRPADELCTCALVELGFLRVSMQNFAYTAPQAAQALASIRRDVGHFLAELPPPDLPGWVTRGDETTDGYLCRLAATHGLRLATFDARLKDPVALLVT